MAKSLVLHLGDHKTGSTSIQYALQHKVVEAPGRTILYPTPPGLALHHNAAGRTLRRERRADQRPGFFGPIAKMVEASDADVAILSAESFEVADPVAVKAVLETYFPDLAASARLLVYLRPHSERLLSSYAEQIKQGLFFGSLDEFHEKYLLNEDLFYAPRLVRWKAQFGDQLNVRVMMRAHLSGGDVVRDFFDFALEGADFTLGEMPQTNQKLCVEDLAVLATLQVRLRHIDGTNKAKREPARALGWRVARMLEATRAQDGTGGGTPLQLHRALAGRLADSYRADAETLDRLYFGDLPDAPLSARLQAACDSACDVAQSHRFEDHFSPDTIRLTQAWLELIERLFCLRPEDWSQYFKDNPLIV